MVNGRARWCAGQTLRLAAACAVAPLLFGCTTPEIVGAVPSPVAPVGNEPAAAAPRYASYDCGPAGALTVENFQTSALAVPPDGPGLELPAEPSGQGRRFRSGAGLLVLGASRARLERDGRPSLDCLLQPDSAPASSL